MTDLLLPARCIEAGDFNAHHSLWDSRVRTPKRHEALLELINNNNLNLINGPDTYTYKYHTGQLRSVLDLTFACPDTIDLITKCSVMEHLATGSDHKVVFF